jgi:hypothetical protein
MLEGVVGVPGHEDEPPPLSRNFAAAVFLNFESDRGQLAIDRGVDGETAVKEVNFIGTCQSRQFV